MGGLGKEATVEDEDKLRAGGCTGPWHLLLLQHRAHALAVSLESLGSCRAASRILPKDGCLGGRAAILEALEGDRVEGAPGSPLLSPPLSRRQHPALHTPAESGAF